MLKGRDDCQNNYTLHTQTIRKLSLIYSSFLYGMKQFDQCHPVIEKQILNKISDIWAGVMCTQYVLKCRLQHERCNLLFAHNGAQYRLKDFPEAIWFRRKRIMILNLNLKLSLSFQTIYHIGRVSQLLQK